MTEITVPHAHVGLLYEDGVFTEVLEPGKHTLSKPFPAAWFDTVDRHATLVDLRQRSLTLKGQEILTADKVAVRVSLLVTFQVTDAVAAIHAVDDYEGRIYEDVQLAARRFLASRKLDDILADRNEISDAVRDAVRDNAAAYGVEVVRADVKDLVFPGNLRQIMNQVLETERRAQAKLVAAQREAESALVRARAEAEEARLQLDTMVDRAKRVAEEPALLRLEELQTLRAMARSGAKFVVGLDGDVLSARIQAD